VPVIDNGILRASKRLLLIFGSVLALFGFTALAAELWRTWTGLNQIRPRYLGLAFLILSCGLSLIQTLNPMQLIKAFLAYQRSRYPGGQRAYDPPPETAPRPIPRDKWPKVPPRSPPRGD
jgi:hypothetical protein